MATPPDGDVPMLVVVRGANAGSRFALTDDVTTIGRHPDSDVFLDDVTVSRRHAEIERRGAVLELSDVGSLNGTYVNGDRIERVALSEGDQLQVGKYRLVVVVGGPGVVD
jgi:pSer/pThr/pTyr-binding forkhead associated (FHA) protein